jgi:hypothetical protein
MESEVQTSVENYGDLVVQNIGSRHRTPASNLPDTLPVDGQLADYDVMGELDRYGADEGVLLAQKLRGLTVALQGTYTAEANVEFEYTFGFDSDQVGGVDNINRDDSYGSNADTRVANEVNNDLLYHVSGKATAGFRDTGTQTSAAPESFFTDSETNYMNEIGVLPEVSLREDLEEYMLITSGTDEQPNDGSLTIYSNWQLYFLETDDDVEGRSVDIV